MTVRELTELLAQHPHNMEVAIRDNDHPFDVDSRNISRVGIGRDGSERFVIIEHE